jgi:O-antigen/teichoic acid export membrane protein
MSTSHLHQERSRGDEMRAAPTSSLLAHRKALSTSVLNQAISSGTNFVLGFFLVRALPAAEFGLYGLGLAVCYLYSGVGNALFLTQMVVHAPERAEHERLPYAARMLATLAAFGATTLVLFALAIVSAGALIPTLAPYQGLATGVALASVSFLLKDYFVRHAYTARREARALAVNCGVAAFLLVTLTVLHLVGVALGGTIALMVFAGSQTAGALVGLFLSRLPFGAIRWRGVLDVAAESWNGGRWAIGGVVVTWAQTQAYAYVTALFAGTSGVGRANAARLLVSPFLFLVPAVNQVTMPRLADMRVRDRGAMLKAGKLVTASLLGLAAVYSTLLLAATDSIVPVLLGRRYTGMRWVVGAWCLVLLTMLLRDGASNLLQVMKHFRALTLLNVVSAVASITCVAALTPAFGSTGAVLGSVSGELVLAALLWWRVRREYDALR